MTLDTCLRSWDNATEDPAKIRNLERAGFVNRGGKGSHRNFSHATGVSVTLSGQEGEDAKRYQERAVAQAISDSEQEDPANEGGES